MVNQGHHGTGGDADEDADGSSYATEDDQQQADDPDNVHRNCNKDNYDRDEHNYPKGAVRRCKARFQDRRYENYCWCSSHRGCEHESQFTSKNGMVSRKTCRKCRDRTTNRTTKSHDDKAKQKARGKTTRNLDTASSVIKSQGPAGVLAAVNDKITQQRGRKKGTASEYNIGNFLEEPESDDEVLDLEDIETEEDIPERYVRRRTPDDDDDDDDEDVAGHDGSMGGGLTGTLIAT